MKRILLSLLVIAGIGGAMIAGARAYFSDIETSTNNTLQAGTIDIAVDGENPWTTTEAFTLANMLPGENNTMNHVIANVGNRELVLWKQVKVTGRNTGTVSEPECVAEGGTWTSPTGPCTGNTAVDNLDSQLVYGMTIDSAVNINPTWDLRVSDIDSFWIPLGRINAGSSITVEQTYDFDKLAGNQYQGDQLVFDVTYYAEQVGAPGPAHTTGGVVLENKTTATEWAPIVGDGTFALLKWDGAGNYRLRAWGLTSNNFRLQAWDAATDSDLGFLSTAQASTGTLDFTGTAAGLNTFAGAKIWLREVSTWNNANTLWESNLVN